MNIFWRHEQYALNNINGGNFNAKFLLKLLKQFWRLVKAYGSHECGVVSNFPNHKLLGVHSDGNRENNLVLKVNALISFDTFLRLMVNCINYSFFARAIVPVPTKTWLL